MPVQSSRTHTGVGFSSGVCGGQAHCHLSMFYTLMMVHNHTNTHAHTRTDLFSIRSLARPRKSKTLQNFFHSLPTLLIDPFKTSNPAEPDGWPAKTQRVREMYHTQHTYRLLLVSSNFLSLKQGKGACHEQPKHPLLKIILDLSYRSTDLMTP